MSMRADIEANFDRIIEQYPEITEYLLTCKFGVYESLEWDDAAEETAQTMLDKGFKIDGNMACYLDLTQKVLATAGDNVPAEIEYIDKNGKVVGYWAYGNWHPDFPLKG